MEAIQYLQNQIILDNCKEYLKLLDFLPKQEEIWNIVNNCKPEFVQATQNFEATENCTKIKFDIYSFLEQNDAICIDGDLVPPVVKDFFELEVILIRNNLYSISFNMNSLLNLNRTVTFMNNKVRKVVDEFQVEISHKKRISYYLDKELIHTSLAEYAFGHRYLEECAFIEKSTTSECNYWYHDVGYERDYLHNLCYIQKYPRHAEELSHNQFEKRSKGVLKRVRRLGQTPEKK